MSTCLDYDAFAALLDGRLDSIERRAALAHIARCVTCRETATDLGYVVPPDLALAATVLAPSDSNPALIDTAAAPAIGRRLGDPARVSDAMDSIGGGGADVEPMIGRVVAGYRVQRQIGRGGMGAVYEALHERMKQRAAVKVMFSQFSMDPSFMRRFRAEARAASVVRHPGLVTIFNYGQLSDGQAYIMMEFLSGESLRSRMDSRRIPVAESLRLVGQIASALNAVHQNGIVHRDLKPENVMIVPDADVPNGERTKVVDFGIAKLDSSQLTNHSTNGAITGTQSFIGTVAYASPEQCRMSSTLDGKSDVYSLGIILYELLSGDLPFSGTVSEVLGLHISEKPRPLRALVQPVPAAVVKLVYQMLAKSPQERPLMSAVRDRIDKLLPDVEQNRGMRRGSITAAVLGILCVIAALCYAWGRV